MKTFLIVSIIILIPIVSCLTRNIYRCKKNLPLEDNFCGRLVEKIAKKK